MVDGAKAGTSIYYIQKDLLLQMFIDVYRLAGMLNYVFVLVCYCKKSCALKGGTITFISVKAESFQLFNFLNF
jgi:hypothetical protein